MARKPSRHNTIAVRLTDEEIAAVRAAASFNGQSISDWIRTTVQPHTQRLCVITVNGVKVTAT